MEVTAEGLVESLATNIWWQRKKQVEEQFFREISEATYNKWFVEPYGNSGAPFLDPMKHGGFTSVDGDEIHYYMLKRKYYSSYKKGNRYYPRKKSMEKSVMMAKNLMRYDADAQVKKMKTSYGMNLYLSYQRTPAEFSDTKYGYKFQEGVVDDAFTERAGKMSSLDKLIVESVRQWSLDNGITCTIEYRE